MGEGVMEIAVKLNIEDIAKHDKVKGILELGIGAKMKKNKKNKKGKENWNVFNLFGKLKRNQHLYTFYQTSSKKWIYEKIESKQQIKTLIRTKNRSYGKTSLYIISGSAFKKVEHDKQWRQFGTQQPRRNGNHRNVRGGSYGPDTIAVCRPIVMRPISQQQRDSNRRRAPRLNQRSFQQQMPRAPMPGRIIQPRVPLPVPSQAPIQQQPQQQQPGFFIAESISPPPSNHNVRSIPVQNSQQLQPGDDCDNLSYISEAGLDD